MVIAYDAIRDLDPRSKDSSETLRVLFGNTDDISTKDLTNKSIERVRRCARCHGLFTQRTNLGKYKCSYHSGIIDGSSGVYTCCNGPIDSQGCVRSMHVCSIEDVIPGTTLIKAGRTIAKIPFRALFGGCLTEWPDVNHVQHIVLYRRQDQPNLYDMLRCFITVPVSLSQMQ